MQSRSDWKIRKPTAELDEAEQARKVELAKEAKDKEALDKETEVKEAKDRRAWGSDSRGRRRGRLAKQLDRVE